MSRLCSEVSDQSTAVRDEWGDLTARGFFQPRLVSPISEQLSVVCSGTMMMTAKDQAGVSQCDDGEGVCMAVLPGHVDEKFVVMLKREEKQVDGGQRAVLYTWAGNYARTCVTRSSPQQPSRLEFTSLDQ